jgi:two-component system chemotaxis sensor kinase CheA
MPTPPPPLPETGTDLGAYHALFFDEAADNLQRLEQMLLALDPASPDDEALHAIFRCAHSVKGGAATFGLADVADLTHQMETLLDRLRRHELQPSAAMVDDLLHAADALRLQLAAHQASGVPTPDVTALLARLRELARAGPATTSAGAAPERRMRLTIGPLRDAGVLAEALELFADIPDLGHIEADPLAKPADGLHRYRLRTRSSDAELRDVLSFHLAADQLRLELEETPGAPPPAATQASTLPVAQTPEAATLRVQSPDTATLRVPLDKVDALLNLVGELLITQSMLVQRCATLQGDAPRQLATELADLERHTRQLQDAVMSIRMIPMSVVFSRFPRLLRDLARQLGKQIELVTVGDATELDKGLVERLTDPLMHLVRNCADHGIEPPSERIAAGKPPAGTITLAASHQGGSIVIEVRDDGRGLSRQVLLDKARERGLPAPDTLRDEQVWALIFAPGFSTAAQVTEVSGRGVGLDVVQRNIADLGGSVEIESRYGQGMTLRVRLPLTLAIMEGMTVRVSDETYVLPLAAVVESLRADAAVLHGLGGEAQVLRHRDTLVPVLDLARIFDVPQTAAGGGSILVVAEAHGQCVALRVDELLRQQPVVVKNLEANYARVDNVAGATLLGDGRVALILDVAALVRRTQR